MSQCDTDVETVTVVTTEIATVAAYKHYLQQFKADAANLKNENGARRTICGRINKALIGMIGHIEVVGLEDRLKLKEYMDGFYNDIHAPMVKQYPNDNVMDMPMGLYKKAFDALYNLAR